MISKRSIRPLFSAVFVFAAAAVTLCLRIIVSGAGRDMFTLTDTIRTQTHQFVFNETLLAFAAVDLADNILRQNVEHLVDGEFQNPKTHFQRSFRSIERYRLNTVRRGPTNLSFHKLQLNSRRYLRDWWRNRRFNPDVMSKSNTVNTLNSNSGKKYKTCAVVGNSGILLKTNLGEAIDNHEFVIRLNNARIGGYERFVGAKTSISFMNSNILHLCSRRGGCYCHPYGQHVPIIICVSQPIHFLDYTVCNSSHKSPLLITDPQLDVLCSRIVKYYSVKRYVESGNSLEAWTGSHGGPEFHYSSGMQAVMVALGACEKVSMFGFGKSGSAKHHYHTNQKSELGLHDYEAEYDFYEDLVKNPEAVPFVSDKFKFPSVVIHR